MARAYFDDARHFRERGELEKALANVNYAHGWLDAGARIGLFEVGGGDHPLTPSEDLWNTGAFVVAPTPLQGAKLQLQPSVVLGAPGCDPRISAHGHHRPPVHSADPEQ